MTPRALLAAAIVAAAMTTTDARADTYKDTRAVADEVCKGANTNPHFKACEAEAAGVYIELADGNEATQDACNFILNAVIKYANPTVFVVQVIAASGAYSSCQVAPPTQQGQPFDPSILDRATGRSVTAQYENGGYFVDGTVGGVPVQFNVDTGSVYVTLVRSLTLVNQSAVFSGTESIQLADGSQSKQSLYLISNICIANMCADNVKTVFIDSGVNLIGVEFLKAAHISTSLKNGTMTLSSER
jgi:predicted aspartyl protease